MQIAELSLIRFRLEGRVYHVYRWGNEHPSPLHHPISGAQVRMVIGHWLTWEFDHALHWVHLVWIYLDYALTPISAQDLTRDLFGEWLVDQILTHRLLLYEELPPMQPRQSFAEYAREAHAPMVAQKPLANHALASQQITNHPQTIADLASSPGNSPAQRQAREQIAKNFYANNCPTFSRSDIESHVNCIDLSHPVTVVDIPPNGGGPRGEQLWQHSFPGRIGQYFAHDSITTAPQLGARSSVLVPGSNTTPPRITPRQQVRFRTDHTAPVCGLRSTAAPALDTWSMSGQPQQTPGGGIQIMIPKNQHAKLAKEP